jgi:hypothetical protein
VRGNNPLNAQLPIISMADINKIQRSKDKIVEILNYLVNAAHSDEETHAFINNLKLSIQIIDNKMDEFKGMK